MGSFSGRIREVGIISIILIIIVSNVLLFYFQNITEHDLRNSLFEEQKQRQLESTKEISQHIGSDTGLVLTMLHGLANSGYLQQGEMSGHNIKKLVEEQYAQFNKIVDRIFILNKNGIMTISLASPGSDTFLGSDFSYRDWVQETRNSSTPIFSNGFERLGMYRVFITIPVINRETNEYNGIVGASILTEPFFAHYGNINDVNSQSHMALDKNGTLLAAGINKNLVGENFFGDRVQQFIHHNTVLDNLTLRLLHGNASYAVYNYGTGESLASGYPIAVNAKPLFFIETITPTAQIYSKLNNVLSIQQVRMFSVFAVASTIAIVVLLILLSKWNIILRREVKRRTRELEESYDEMKAYLKTVLEEMNRR
ncbi:MAG: cache domain-containing protein [Nitrososphaeraceae archaeon]